MNQEALNSAQRLVHPTYIKQAIDASKSRENKISHLFEQRKIPDDGWDDFTIETLLLQLSAMDSNNFPSNCGVGEREGRFASDLVAKRHFRFCHGIGRSGDLTEAQPKAAGSTLMYKLTNELLKDLMKTLGIESPVECLVVPVATGMSIVLSLLALRQVRPKGRYVLWSRIDQKSCFKSITSAGFEPVIIDTIQKDDYLVTDMSMFGNKIKEIGPENIACVITTTSCFAPRICDEIEAVASLSKTYDIPHLINNAYGLQSKYIMKRIQKAQRKGRVDIFVQSTDKNLMVPVGGAIIASFDADFLSKISKVYPGRASLTPVLDVFITLLSLGKKGYLKLSDEQSQMYNYLQEELHKFATSIGEKVLCGKCNPFSIGMTLSSMQEENLTKLGSMLFIRNVTGGRVVTTNEEKTISNFKFKGWGCHCSNFNVPYITAAASIGMKKEDVDCFVKKLGKVIGKVT